MQTTKLVPLYGPEDIETVELQSVRTERMNTQRSYGAGNCAWVNNMLRHSSCMLVAHSNNMGDFKVLGISQYDREWATVRVWTKTGEATIVLPWYSKFDLFLGNTG